MYKGEKKNMKEKTPLPEKTSTQLKSNLKKTMLDLRRAIHKFNKALNL